MTPKGVRFVARAEALRAIGPSVFMVALFGCSTCPPTSTKTPPLRQHTGSPLPPAGLPQAAAPAGCVALDVDGRSAEPPQRIRHVESGIELVYVPPGAFEMGEGVFARWKEGSDVGPRHYRLVRRGFYLGVTEVTVGQWRQFATSSGYQTDLERGAADKPGFVLVPQTSRPAPVVLAPHVDARWDNPLPSHLEFVLLDSQPVTQVTGRDATTFAEHYDMQLPSEVQWEYAYRAGDSGRLPRLRQGGHNNIFKSDGFAFLAPCGSYPQNRWGLHDMAGNVSEYCADRWVEGKQFLRVDESPVPSNSRSSFGGMPRVVRGSSWTDGLGQARYAYRVAGWLPSCDRGFRVTIQL